jgi:hypothetical protein
VFPSPTGSANAQTVTFGLDGKSYTIDLGKKGEAALRKVLATYVEAARQAAPEAPGRARRGHVQMSGVWGAHSVNRFADN